MTDINSKVTKTSPGSVQAVRGTTGKNMTIIVSYMAVGRWK